MARGTAPTIRYETQIPIFASLPQWTAFVDPGPSTGIICLERPPKPEMGAEFGRFYCPLTFSGDQAQDYFGRFCLNARKASRRVNLVIEEYRIYPNKVAIHSGKTVPTAEIIGGFKYICRKTGGYCVENASQVKQPTAGMLRDRRIALLGGTEHARDAELHMWYTVFRMMERTDI